MLLEASPGWGDSGIKDLLIADGADLSQEVPIPTEEEIQRLEEEVEIMERIYAETSAPEQEVRQIAENVRKGVDLNTGIKDGVLLRMSDSLKRRIAHLFKPSLKVNHV